MQKKALLLIVILALSAIVGTVVAQDDPLADVDPSGVTIEYWHEWDGAQGEGMTAMIELFNSTNEWGITVEELPKGGSSDVRNDISTGITSGELPNLAGAGFATDAMGYYLDGVLTPLDQFVDSPTWGFSEEEAALIDFSIIDRNRPAFYPFDGQLLAWPVGISAEIMSTNLDLLAQLDVEGLDGVPADTAQFAEAACAVGDLDGVTAGYGARTSGQHAYTWMLNFGGVVFDAEADAYVFTDEGSLAGLQYVQDLFNDGCLYFPDGGFFANTGEFSLGLNAFAPGSSVGVPFIQGDMDDAVEEGLLDEAYNWVNVPFPAGPAGSFVVPSLRGVTMFESTAEENLATWLFIKWWATDATAQNIWTESAQYQPYNVETVAGLSEEFLAENPQFGSFADTLADDTVTLSSLPEHPSSFDVSLVAGGLLSDITIGGMDVAEAAAAAEAEANEIYQEDLEELEDF